MPEPVTLDDLSPEIRQAIIAYRKFAYSKMLETLPAWQREMVAAVPDAVLRDVVNDSRRGVSEASSMAKTPGAPPPVARPRPGNEPTPLRPPPGVALCDALMDEQDRKDRAELMERLQAASKQAVIDAHWREKLAE
jgi:hypothetical protein